MAAPAGNRFWELRAKHGRDKIFTAPEAMWEAACGYFEWCEDNPLYEKDWVGKDAKEVEKPRVRAFTMQGLCLYLGINTKYFNDFETALAGKEDAESIDFSEIVTRIRETIFTQKFTAAAAGFLKESIIARELGLADKKEHSGGIDITQITGMEIK